VDGKEQDREIRRVGFKHVDWVSCEGAPESADPWICVVNGSPIFLQGVNFPPVLPNFADISRNDYETKLSIYKDMGLNCFRINACQYLEKADFYDLCDEYGLMVWQEFPLTSSGIDNWPPEDEDSIHAVTEIAASYIRRRGHHVSLLLWSGGNELQGDFEGNKSGIGKPCGLSHPMLKMLGEVANSLDPIHRYIPTSPTGPRAGATPEEFGLGVHWDVHGGASMLANLQAVEAYCAEDDALFRSETYCPGASPVELIRRYAGNFDPWPPTTDNPYWTRLTTWWNDWNKLVTIHGREPVDLEEYVSWSQELQAQLVSIEMKSCKDRFPRCGGVLHWSGHDTFPLTINSSFIDFDNHLKPSGEAVKKIWKEVKS
jgi:beta-mannosidase